MLGGYKKLREIAGMSEIICNFELRSRSALPLATEGTQEDRLHLTFGRPLSRLGHRCTHHGSRCSIGSEAKINCDLFCVSLDLHYLCSRNA